MKISLSPFPALFPLPVVLVTCGLPGRPPDIVPVAWTGTVSSAPPMISVSLRPERYSLDVIRKTGEFAVNLPGEPLLAGTDLTGACSGRDTDKFALTGWTPKPSTSIIAPLIAECPVNFECRVVDMIRPGSEHVLIGEILAVHVDDHCLLPDNRLDFGRIRPITLSGAEYRGLGPLLAVYGFSSREK